MGGSPCPLWAWTPYPGGPPVPRPCTQSRCPSASAEGRCSRCRRRNAPPHPGLLGRAGRLRGTEASADPLRGALGPQGGRWVTWAPSRTPTRAGWIRSPIPPAPSGLPSVPVGPATPSPGSSPGIQVPPGGGGSSWGRGCWGAGHPSAPLCSLAWASVLSGPSLPAGRPVRGLGSGARLREGPHRANLRAQVWGPPRLRFQLPLALSTRGAGRHPVCARCTHSTQAGPADAQLESGSPEPRTLGAGTTERGAVRPHLLTGPSGRPSWRRLPWAGWAARAEVSVEVAPRLRACPRGRRPRACASSRQEVNTNQFQANVEPSGQ